MEDWRVHQTSAAQCRELETIFAVQELSMFSGWSEQSAITWCETPLAREAASLPFEWHELRKGTVRLNLLQVFLCLSHLGTSSFKLMAPWMLSFSLELSVYVGQGKWSSGDLGCANSWRNVIVNWLRKFERSNLGEEDVVFKGVTFR